MRARLLPLLRKELRQIRRSRSALLSSTLLPLLLMVGAPSVQFYALILATPFTPAPVHATAAVMVALVTTTTVAKS